MNGRAQRSAPRRVPFVLSAMLAALVAIVAPACIDESHDLQVQALGDEAPGVPRGPTHRPGQPCLVCHGGLGPGSPQFVMAGTVYAVEGQTAAAQGAAVQIEDATGAFYTATTNEVGNFYITTGQWAPAFPALAQVTQGHTIQPMVTHIGRDGSCAGCHVRPESSTSPGPVYVTSVAPADGGP